jgi:hypothetical protein
MTQTLTIPTSAIPVQAIELASARGSARNSAPLVSICISFLTSFLLARL